MPYSICKRIEYFLFFIIISAGLFRSYANQISVSPVPIYDQLPSNSVQRVYQDKEGFLWLGTLDGLCRYDGYKITVFRSNLNNPGLLTNNEITCITEDSLHLWIGTKKGINILNKRTCGIEHFPDKQIEEENIKYMITASDGSIWVGTSNKILRYGADLKLIKKYDAALPFTSTNFIYEDNDHNLWAGFWNNGLYRYIPEKDTFINYPQIGASNNPFRIFQDNKGQHWVCTWGDGVFLFNPEKEEYDMYEHIREIQSPENRFYSITQDDKYNYIWLMSISGLNALEYTEDGKLKEVDISYLFKESNNIFSEIMKDKTGNLWIGTFSEGLLSINFDKPVIQNYPIPSIKEKTGITPNITAIYEDNEGDIWINQNRWGLGFFSPDKNEVYFFTDFPSLKNIRSMGIINCISGFRSIPGQVWIGSESESVIYCMQKNGENVVIDRKIDLAETAKNPGHLRIFFEDRKNNIWIVTSNALFVKPYNKSSIEHLSSSLGFITAITEDTRGAIWISTNNSGIYQLPLSGNLKINESQLRNYSKKNNNLISDNIETICADLSGKVWIGTKEGNIVSYDIVSQKFEDLSESFKTMGEGILNIVTDDFGHIWVSTNKRITEYNPENMASRDYTVTDGVLVNSFLTNSYFKNATGKLYFGGNKGISVFTPSEKLSEEPKKTKTIITDIKINNQSVLLGNNNEKFDVLSQTLILESTDKNIEIDFSSLDYTYSSKIRYAYKIEGVDDDWVYTENNRQFAFYNQLGKGSHTFYIKATDENRQWNSEITEVRIYKHPAFYETWWAYTFYIIFTFICICLAFAITRNRINLRNELKIAQIEKEKSEELTQTKLRYFTNISHDFLTPLTIISCLIDDAEITYKNKPSQFEAMRSNVNRLRRLLQQVLDFRKVESGNMKLKISYGDIVMFVRDMCYIHFLPLMSKKNIDFTFNSTPNLIQAYFDADKIDKIIFNLLSNAFKYTPENGKVSLILNRIIKNGISVLNITITDTGIGIDPEDLNNIFTRFYTNKTSEAGTTNGIGLSLTKDLVELHHGTINAISKHSEGTTFIIEIPIDKKEYNDAEVERLQQITVNDDAPELLTPGNIYEVKKDETEDFEKGHTTILLVEDNEELLVLMKNILSKHYHILTATNGIEGINTLKNKDVDIIVSDVMMPEMDGLELCRVLKKNLETSHIPVILLTAKNTVDDRIECYNAGADGYISKPFDLKVLDARINNFLSNKKSKQKEFKTDVEINISTLEYPSLDEQFLTNAVKIIEEYLTETEFDVNTFAENLNMSKSSLYRKIKTMTGLSPIEFIRNIRLKHACQMLKDHSIPISEVAYSVGFSNPKYFSACFKEEFNVTPSEYQRDA